jgi:REP element-mobilizing transposase RayT
MQPIYTIENTTPAFQLNWSVGLFAKAHLPPPSDWLDSLKTATEPDGVRILEFRSTRTNVGQFLVSTLPQVSPSQIIRSLKGRWQYLIRERLPSVFRRNYHIGSVGQANCRVLDQYVARQTSKHPMAAAHVQQRFQSLQFCDAAIDLGQCNRSSHGQLVHGLQVVMENEAGWHEIRTRVLADSRAMIIRAAKKKGWRLSRIGLLSNHLHVLIGPTVTDSPASVALSLLNNLAYVQGMKPVFRFSYYVGTFGPYDRNAVRLGLRRLSSE